MKMKDGRTHLAHKAEHAVDLDTGAVVAVTLQGADQGDTVRHLSRKLCSSLRCSHSLGRNSSFLGQSLPEKSFDLKPAVGPVV